MPAGPAGLCVCVVFVLHRRLEAGATASSSQLSSTVFSVNGVNVCPCLERVTTRTWEPVMRKCSSLKL